MNPSKGNAPPRRYGFACLICRRRKIKCDGKKPNCANCIKVKELCSYKETPSYNSHLFNQLQQSKKRLDSLESQLRDLASLDREERDHRLTEILREFDHLNMEEISPSQATDMSHSYETENDAEGENLPYGNPADFSIGEHGTYYGATSRFHPLDCHENCSVKNSGTEEQEHKTSEEYHRKWLGSNSKYQESLENMALENLKQYTSVPLDICATLLQIYWTWQAPLHNCVYRRCFYRDLALGGPYCSPFLVNVILAHACRHLKDDDPRYTSLERGKHFMEKAKQELLIELEQEKPKIPTIQGLLILGGRQCAIGKNSEGWLYTGMANRMVTDLGLHLYKGNLKGLDGLDPDDLEVRKRLYLSAYAWDKSISLCLGRPPSLPALPYSPDSLFDLSDNDVQWQPVYPKQGGKTYPSTKSLNTLNFIHFCKLAKIINEAYEKVYSRRIQYLKLQCILELENKLRDFHQCLPDQLRIQPKDSSEYCLPPHIFCLNILCHTMLILIYRPFFAWSRHERLKDHPLAHRAQQVCTEEATKVNEHFRRYGQTFNFQNQTYLASYCVYTAATVDIQQIRHEDTTLATAAATRLSVTLNMLESEAKQTPGIKRSIDIIKSHLTRQQESEKPPNAQCFSSDGTRVKLETISTPLSLQIPNYSNSSYSLDSGLATASPHTQLESPLCRYPQNTARAPVRLQMHPGNPEMTHHRQTQNFSAHAPEENIGSLMTQAMDVDTTWTDWGFFNAGGGFVQDNRGWAPFDSTNNFNIP
ncbi:hypothetical protein N7456_005117 [Penicillium angulare]|uniref:Zn(2)-C6 fungal-type domain-containing protein n=1 Tax=Penicillium angulare TaxID=116970 RepID=A0A9W9FZG9_9EURO|nr:hypothetical protein N7456_005117 [Penicillium angulare]